MWGWCGVDVGSAIWKKSIKIFKESKLSFFFLPRFPPPLPHFCFPSSSSSSSLLFSLLLLLLLLLLKCHIHFSFSHGIEKQIWILLFVFRFRLTLKNGFELRISFFVFASLWKTDCNFVSRFVITMKNRSEFRLSFWHDLKNGSLHQFSHLKPRPPPRGWPGHALFM